MAHRLVCAAHLCLPLTHIHSLGACRGLDQSVALPQDSYLQPYFRDVMSVLRQERKRTAFGLPNLPYVCTLERRSAGSLAALTAVPPPPPPPDAGWAPP